MAADGPVTSSAGGGLAPGSAATASGSPVISSAGGDAAGVATATGSYPPGAPPLPPGSHYEWREGIGMVIVTVF